MKGSAEPNSPFSETGALAWLPYARQSIDESDIAAVSAVLRSDFVTQGPAIEAFESALARATGAKHAIAVSSGTAALHLVCLGLNLGPGQTGVTSPITFAASANCFRYAGASVAFTDVNPKDGLMDATSLRDRLAELHRVGEPPGVVIAVSLAGRAPDLPGLAAVCAEFGWSLVEDAAHALGGEYAASGQRFRCGSCAHTRASILSFHPVKHICTGEGGAILTNEDALAARLRRLRSHGMEKPRPIASDDQRGGWYYEQVELGYHYRLTDIQAALGSSQLQRLPVFLERRRARAQRYASDLFAAPFSRVLEATPFSEGHAYHLYVVRFRSAALRRAAFDFLAERRIGSQVHYIPVYRHPDFRQLLSDITRPGAEAYYTGCLSLPLFPDMSDADQDRVIEALRAFAGSHG